MSHQCLIVQASPTRGRLRRWLRPQPDRGQPEPQRSRARPLLNPPSISQPRARLPFFTESPCSVSSISHSSRSTAWSPVHALARWPRPWCSRSRSARSKRSPPPATRRRSRPHRLLLQRCPPRFRLRLSRRCPLHLPQRRPPHVPPRRRLRVLQKRRLHHSQWRRLHLSSRHLTPRLQKTPPRLQTTCPQTRRPPRAQRRARGRS
jgi:hypothetical protein